MGKKAGTITKITGIQDNLGSQKMPDKSCSDIDPGGGHGNPLLSVQASVQSPLETSPAIEPYPPPHAQPQTYFDADSPGQDQQGKKTVKQEPKPQWEEWKPAWHEQQLQHLQPQAPALLGCASNEAYDHAAAVALFSSDAAGPCPSSDAVPLSQTLNFQTKSRIVL